MFTCRLFSELQQSILPDSRQPRWCFCRAIFCVGNYTNY